MNLIAPIRLKDKTSKIELYVVYAVGKDNLEWMLLTTLPVENIDQAIEKLNWYKRRWQIEVFHKTLKSGCTVEDCRLETADRLIRYLSLMSIIAWRIFWLSYISKTNPQSSAEIVVTDLEKKALLAYWYKDKPKPKKLSAKDASILIAKLGGFLARKNDGNPGITTIWRGWNALQLISVGFNSYTYG